MIYQKCIACGEKYGADEIVYSCKRCGDILEVQYDYELIDAKLKKSNWQRLPISVWRYKDFMPIRDPSKIVSF